MQPVPQHSSGSGFAGGVGAVDATAATAAAAVAAVAAVSISADEAEGASTLAISSNCGGVAEVVIANTEIKKTLLNFTAWQAFLALT
jgi:hypothetical protein